MISLILPYHDIPETAFFLKRCIDSIMMQTYKDYEIVLVKNGKMAENTNSGIKRAKGDLIKILFMDDAFASPNSLQEIVDNFTDSVDWLITGCDTNIYPRWTDDIETGNNKLGSPSCLAFRNKDCVLFDERLSWLLDVVYYKEMYKKFGKPKIVNGVNILMGIGKHQMTHTLSDEIKQDEHNYVFNKYKV
jgi:glycosyltransferase involved in cell wall biosynthesis